MKKILVLAGILILLEGIAGYGLFVGRLQFGPQLAERRHTQYDPLLGWVNAPGLRVPDMYGPGIALSTNARGFRNEIEFEPHVPVGRTRVICSGDSYTLGYGVGNDQTWCQLLTRFDARIESVNMGQGGYGLDQAYLWYKRDGAVLVRPYGYVGWRSARGPVTGDELAVALTRILARAG